MYAYVTILQLIIYRIHIELRLALCPFFFEVLVSFPSMNKEGRRPSASSLVNISIADW